MSYYQAIFVVLPYAILSCVILTSAAEFRHWRPSNSKALETHIFTLIQTCHPIRCRIAMFSSCLLSVLANQMIDPHLTPPYLLLKTQSASWGRQSWCFRVKQQVKVTLCHSQNKSCYVQRDFYWLWTPNSIKSKHFQNEHLHPALS